VTPEDIFAYVYEKVRQKHNQRPVKFVTEGAGDFILVGVPPTEPSVERTNPYVLGEKNLSFTDFPDILKDTSGNDGKINVAVVIGSGRCKVADHTSYGTDAVLVPEILNSLKDWSLKEWKGDIVFSSYLDIDIFGTDDIAEKNLIIIGSGKVNLLTIELLTYFYRALKVRFPHPDKGDIFSECGVYEPGAGEPSIHEPRSRNPRWYYAELINCRSNEGLLSLMRNPWADEKGKKRIIILLAGSHPIGTIASMRVLNDFINYKKKRKNNRYDKHIPAKVVRGHRIDDKEYLKRYHELQATPRNTPTYIGNITGYTVVE
jgi:hypothetical protein